MLTKTSKKRPGTKLPEAMSMLAKDHKMVSRLFKQYEKSEGGEKREVLQQICAALTAHAALEEELFYPALREALSADGEALLDEATVEHSTVKALVAELAGAEPGAELVDAKVTVLSEYVKHHVQEEEEEMFPQAKKAKGLDLEALGAAMAARKAELEAEAGVGENPRSSGSKGRSGRNAGGERKRGATRATHSDLEQDG